MAPQITSMALSKPSESPYQLDTAQTLKAASALLKHMHKSAIEKEASGSAKNLLSDDPQDPSSAQPVHLILATKKHIAPKLNIKPRKIQLPHSIYSLPSQSICLITPSPQRTFKDLIAHPDFSPDLSKRITRVIDVDKLKKKYRSFESKRQLRDSHDIFLVDDRISAGTLIHTLGKTFYNGIKVPFTVRLTPYEDKKEKKNAALPSTKPKKEASAPRAITTPQAAAAEITRALSATFFTLKPTVTTSICVGRSSHSPEQLRENIEAVILELTDKYIPRKWRGVKAMHIKGTHTMALPIWLADELWDDAGMVLEDQAAAEAKAKATQKDKRQKRLLENATTGAENVANDDSHEGKKRKKGHRESREGSQKKKQKVQDEGFNTEMKERRQKLREQKNKLKEGLANVETSIATAA